ncbi:MAG: DegV family protein, partial [Clostridia bacterium]|nr:DegV family protein [Clostridia bacterium]
MSVRFIIDSASDILPADAEALGMVHLPLRVGFDDVEYRDSVDLTHRDFYMKLVESDVLPRTSQIPPSEFQEACERVIADGDTPIVITVSSKLSGTYQSAMIAAGECSGDVYVIDSENVAVGERILIERGLSLVREGLSAEEIADILNAEKKKIRIMALVDTLEYLRKGGRVSGAAALVGGVLSIKPVIAIENGEVVVVGKARG